MHIETQAIMTRVMTGKAPHDVVYGIINYFRKHVSTCSISSYRYTASIKGFHKVSPETVEAVTTTEEPIAREERGGPNEPADGTNRTIPQRARVQLFRVCAEWVEYQVRGSDRRVHSDKRIGCSVTFARLRPAVSVYPGRSDH